MWLFTLHDLRIIMVCVSTEIQCGRETRLHIDLVCLPTAGVAHLQVNFNIYFAKINTTVDGHCKDTLAIKETHFVCISSIV